jgi:hypothetical protein
MHGAGKLPALLQPLERFNACTIVGHERIPNAKNHDAP